MKAKITRLVLLAIISGVQVKAQIATNKCGIYYDYDAAGNRIKKYYDCKQADDGSSTIPPVVGSARRTATDSVLVADAHDGDATLFPNPAHDFFVIKFKQSVEKGHLHLYDAKGQLISGGDIEGVEYRQNIEHLAPGVYYIRVIVAMNRYNFKLTKL